MRETKKTIIISGIILLLIATIAIIIGIILGGEINSYDAETQSLTTGEEDNDVGTDNITTGEEEITSIQCHFCYNGYFEWYQTIPGHILKCNNTYCGETMGELESHYGQNHENGGRCKVCSYQYRIHEESDNLNRYIPKGSSRTSSGIFV